MRKQWIISDLDGVIMGRVRERNGNDSLPDYINLLTALKKIGNYELIFLTDRGVEQLAPLVYLLNASTIHGGESGAAAYLAFPHQAFINPLFTKIATKIVNIRKQFFENFGNEYPMEPGVLTSIRIERVGNKDLTEAYNFLSDFTNGCMELTISDHGDCISLKPKNINKLIGINWLARLYLENHNPIDFKNSLWIGDGFSDICVANYIQKNGGKIAGVANSHPEYKDFICEKDGYLAKKSYTKGMIEILNHFN